MATHVRTLDSVYEEIAGLTGNRAELERQRFAIVKAQRAIRALLEDGALGYTEDNPMTAVLLAANDECSARKAILWSDIERTDAGIQRLTDLAQNGAFNA